MNRRIHRNKTRHGALAHSIALSKNGLTALAVSLSLGFGMSAQPARAQETSIQINIAKQSMSSALVQLANEYSLELAYSPDLVAGMTAPVVSGNLTVDQALQKLLAGTGVEFKRNGKNVSLSRRAASAGDETTLPAVTVLGSAEEQLRQSPGVSIITAEDLEKRPPANDLSEIIRTMPGVNLTGSGSSGSYGNSRQIDIRGMGPENTLIMVDGVPVNSRQSIRMGRNGERNTRGDTNWVPADAVESIEVLRGPAATRYGSGAMGGVVNIITKKPEKEWAGNIDYYMLVPEDKRESDTKRADFSLSGPISDKLSFRLYGDIAKTTPDDSSINSASTSSSGTTPAGREGVRNRDINAMFRLDAAPGHVVDFDMGFARQGNIYAGETPAGDTSDEASSLFGSETNTMYRRTASVNWRGDYGEGRTSKVVLSYEGTINNRVKENMEGGGENNGSIESLEWSKSELKNYRLSSEYTTPLSIGGFNQKLTFGGDISHSKLDDPYSTSRCPGESGERVNCTSNTKTTDPESTETLYGLFVEDNIEVLQNLLLIPGIRLDHDNQFGLNWSPSLNAHYFLTPTVTIKAGIAREFKAPNLYQSNENYYGPGCPKSYGFKSCGVYGNSDLDPEISVNKEIGIDWADNNWGAGFTVFQNDYKNKIVTELGVGGYTQSANGTYLFQWHNGGAALVRGLEGHVDIPIMQRQERASLMWRNNFTIMDENNSKKTGEPLSMIPKYTINSSLEWNPVEKVSVLTTATLYGKQWPRKYSSFNGTAITDESALEPREAYHLLSASVGYSMDKNTRIRIGVNNILNYRLRRESSSSSKGANNYNEAGRSFFITMGYSF